VNKFVNLKMDRIYKVELMAAKCTRTPDMVKTDVFHMAANDESYEVELALTPLAARLLIEEYPATESCVSAATDENFPFLFNTTVYNFLPAGRFCLGLPGQVRVLRPAGLAVYLREKMKDFLWG
jgi:proteasome accessory factor C